MKTVELNIRDFKDASKFLEIMYAAGAPDEDVRLAVGKRFFITVRIGQIESMKAESKANRDNSERE